MKHIAVLGAALLSFAGALSVQATPPPSVYVNDSAITGDGMPRLLSEYGFFTDLGAQEPVPHV